MFSRTLSAVILTILTSTAWAEPPTVRFTRNPIATRADGGVRIDFAVSAATDVAVTVEDAGGKIVRHLAAGVLGKNPPAPLKANSLEQSLLWDGKDDEGGPVRLSDQADGKSFRIRVAIGTRPRFDGLLLHNRAATGSIAALATGPGGEVYLFHGDPTANGNMGGNKLKVISRDGKPLRTLMPMPAALPADRLAALGVFRTEAGELVPRIHNYEQLSFYPDPIGSRGRSMPAYSSPAVDKQGRVYWLMLGPRLACLDAQGGVPYPTFYSEPLLDIKGLRISNQYAHGFERAGLAISSDGKWIYFAGLATGTGPKDGKPVPAVFRVNLTTRGPAEVFLGDPAKGGSDEKSFGAPRGLAVANGLLYVADFDNDRIVAFKESDRSLTGQVKVVKPDTIGVDPKTGAIYACCPPDRWNADLVKIDSLESGKELYRLKLPKAGGAPWDAEHRIAVDASADPIVIWLPGLSYSPHNLMRIEDAGDKFTAPSDPRDLAAPWADGPRDLNVDRARDELYVKANPERWYRLDEKTGKLTDRLEPERPALSSSAHGTQLVPGPDGNLYGVAWGYGFCRLDRAGKPLNWPGLDTYRIPLGGIMNFQQRQLEVLSPQELMVVMNPTWFAAKPEGKVAPMGILFPDGGAQPAEKVDPRISSVGVLGPDGRLKRTVIWQCMTGAIVRTDRQGNIYLADMVKPPDRSYPEFFDGKLEAPTKESRAAGDRYWNSYIYGSIIKFPPTGGAIWYRKGVTQGVRGEPAAELLAKPGRKVRAHVGYNPLAEAELQGALWYRFGFAPYSCWSTTSTDTCMCEGSRFDVDDFGRVFFPNVGQFRVEMIDTNGNPIASFGRYGNEDDPGEGPGIPLAWPIAVAVSDTHAYVGDTLNRRVVRVRLDHDEVKDCNLP